MFTSDTFKAFILEFYYNQEDAEWEAFWDIMRKIFSDSGKYRSFIAYCKDHDYAFLPPESRDKTRLVISFLAFEQAKQQVVDSTLDSLHGILGITHKWLELEASRKIIPWTTTSYWQWLQASIYANIAVNNHWEIVYIIWKDDDIYEVYSHESGKHYVNASGYKTTPARRSKIQRIRLRREINEFRELLRAVKDESEIPKKTIYELERLFILDGWCQWNLNFESKIRFRSWLVEKIIEMEKDFNDLVEKDSRKPDLRTVWD